MSPFRAGTALACASVLLGGGAAPVASPPSSGWVDDTAEAARTIAQRAREADQVLVIWLLDQTPSMKDDREALARETDLLTRELKKKARKKDALRMAVYGVGAEAALVQEPTEDRKLIAKAMRLVKEDATGTENWMTAIQAVLAKHRDDPAQKIIVLVTDEEAEDASRVDAAEKELLAQKAQFFCIGAEAGFQASTMNVRVHYTHDKKKFQDNAEIRVGPESDSLELVVSPDRVVPEKTGGIPPGVDIPGGAAPPPPEDVKTPSGFGFYAPSRLAANTGGMYLMIPDPKPSPFQIDRKKMQAHYQPGYAADREPETEYGRRVKAALREARQACSGPGGLEGDGPIKIPSIKGSGLKDIGEMVSRGRKAIAGIQECEEKIREALGELAKRKKKLYGPDARWEANGLLSLVILGEEKTRLSERVRLLQEAIDDGKFDACKTAEKMGLMITFAHRTTRKSGQQAGAPLSLLLELHAGTPWALLGREVEKESGVESISIGMVTPPKDKKKQASPPPTGLPAPPAPPPQ